MPKTFALDAQPGGGGFAERLALFLVVAAQASFSAAARARGLAPSSVARQMDQLEADLGARLLNRSTRKVTLTEAGALLEERGKTALRELEDAGAAVFALSSEPRGRLRVSAPVAFGARHLVPLVAPFLARYPRVELELLLEDRVVDLIEERIDVAVRIGELDDSSLLATRLAGQRRYACASPAYLKRHGTPRRPADLAKHACLTTPGAQRVGWWRFANTPKFPVRGPFVSRSTEALLRAAIDGVGIVHLASWLVDEAVREGKLIKLFADLPPEVERASISLVRAPGSASSKVKAFAEFVKEWVGSPPYWEVNAKGKGAPKRGRRSGG